MLFTWQRFRFPFAGVLGFRLHQSYESRETGYLSALLGFGPELQCTLLELRQQWQPAASSGTAAPAVHAGGNAEEDAAAVLVDLPSPRARRAAPAAPSAQQLVRFMVEKPDLQAAADGLKVRRLNGMCGLRLSCRVVFEKPDLQAAADGLKASCSDAWFAVCRLRLE